MALTAAVLAQEIVTRSGSALALDGMDTVSYFNPGKPVAGRIDIASQHRGAVWRLSSARNKLAFDANPQRYVPQYGGHCAWGTSRGYAVRGDPQVWRIVDCKLYMNYNRSVQGNWSRNIDAHISRANRDWPGVLKTKK